MTQRAFRRSGACLWICSALLLVTAVCVSAQSPPTTLSLVPGKLTVEGCTYAAGATAANLNGSGNLKMSAQLGGQDYQHDFGNVTFTSVASDASGQITSGSLVIPAKKIGDFFGSGLTLDVRGGTASVGKDASGNYVGILDLKLVMLTPFNDFGGLPFQVDMQSGYASLTIDSTGKVDLNCSSNKPTAGASVTIPGITVAHPAVPAGMNPIATGGTNTTASTASTAPVALTGFQAGGIKIEPKDVSFQCSGSPAGKFGFMLSCGSGKVSMSLPGLLTSESSGLALRFDPAAGKPGFSVDQNGMVNIPAMKLYAEANGAPQPIEISLVEPLDFGLRIKQANVAITNCVPTKFAIQTDVMLPKIVKSLGGPSEFKDVQFDLIRGAVATIDTRMAYAGGVDVPGGGVTIIAPGGLASNTLPIPDFDIAGFTVKTNNIVIDLSPNGPDPATMPGIGSPQWMGLYIGEASVGMPLTGFAKAGGLLTVKGTNCFIDATGFTGHMQASTTDLLDASVLGFNAKLSNLSVDIARNCIISSDCSGEIELGPLGKLSADFNINDQGTTATIFADQALNFAPLGMGLSITRGSIHVGPDGLPIVWLDGGLSLVIPDIHGLQNAVISFHDLGVNALGQFVVKDDGWIHLDVPQNIDLGVLQCNLSSVALKQVNNLWELDLNGEISLNSHLPVTGSISVNELAIKPGPIVVAKGIAFDSDVAGLLHISGVVDQSKDAAGPCLVGTADLALRVGNKLALAGTKMGFYIGQGGCWAVAGNGNLGAASALSGTGLALYKFHGGVAQNMTPKNGGSDFQEISDLQPNPGSATLLLAAGCDVGTVPANLFYCSGRMSGTLPRVKLDMHGDAWVFSNDHTQPAPMTADLVLDMPNQYFRVAADTNLVLPSNCPVLRLNGAAELVFSPTDMHCAIGWPYPEKAIHARIFENSPILNFDALAGAYVKFQPNVVGYEFGAGAKFDFDYSIFSGSVDGQVTYDNNSNCLAGKVYADGKVDFGICSLGASADMDVALYIPDKLTFDGEFCADIDTWLGSISVCKSCSGSLP